MRVKRGQTKRARHQKVLASTKGYRMSYNRLYKRAKEASLHAGEYSYAHRKKRASQYRTAWIKSINAICQVNGTKYSEFIANLNKAAVKFDRKVLAYLAVNHESAMQALVKAVTPAN